MEQLLAVRAPDALRLLGRVLGAAYDQRTSPTPAHLRRGTSTALRALGGPAGKPLPEKRWPPALRALVQPKLLREVQPFQPAAPGRKAQPAVYGFGPRLAAISRNGQDLIPVPDWFFDALLMPGAAHPNVIRVVVAVLLAVGDGDGATAALSDRTLAAMTGLSLGATHRALEAARDGYWLLLHARGTYTQAATHAIEWDRHPLRHGTPEAADPLPHGTPGPPPHGTGDPLRHGTPLRGSTTRPEKHLSKAQQQHGETAAAALPGKDDPDVAALVGLGVAIETAGRLVTADRERVQREIPFLPYRIRDQEGRGKPVTKPVGLLLAAIQAKEPWDPPTSRIQEREATAAREKERARPPIDAAAVIAGYRARQERDWAAREQTVQRTAAGPVRAPGEASGPADAAIEPGLTLARELAAMEAQLLAREPRKGDQP